MLRSKTFPGIAKAMADQWGGYIGFSITQEVKKEAYLMINAYGKIEAEKVAVGYASGWIKEINELKHYDGEKIKRMDDRKWYWLTVASAIKNWP